VVKKIAHGLVDALIFPHVTPWQRHLAVERLAMVFDHQGLQAPLAIGEQDNGHHHVRNVTSAQLGAGVNRPGFPGGSYL